jgi:pyrroloquinoline quinone (PQQ) biosynthesis protein C
MLMMITTHSEIISVESSEIISVESIINFCKQQEMSKHPFLKRLSEEPVNLTAIWLFATNLDLAVSKNFVRWLANLIVQIDDDRIASIIAKQINDELGGGRFSQIHSVLLNKFITGLEPWRPNNFTEAMLVPGRIFLEGGKKVFTSQNAFKGIGALIISEVCAEQVQLCISREIRRQNNISRNYLSWLILHEELETDHAEESLILASLLPKEDVVILSDIKQGVEDMHQVIINFLDALYKVTFLD